MHLPPAVLRALQEHYHRDLPRECCGFLLGTRHSDGAVVQRTLPLLNAEPGTGTFALSDAELRRAHRHAQHVGLQLLALYHSHPSGAAHPSTADAEVMARSEWPWLILTAAGADGAVRGHWVGVGGAGKHCSISSP
jgi:proteasome lid subunit RPN8/RPN11